MEIHEVDPSLVTVDKSNERQGGTADAELVENVKATGIIQPPLVRRLNGDGMDSAMGAEYSVAVGGRRVDAATQAGLESIPVIVMDWDDGEALTASITENIDAFRKEVSKKDRAKAVERLKELNGWTNGDVSNELGVIPNTVRRWLEPLRREHKGTSLHADTSTSNGGDGKEPTYKQMETARKLTGGGEEGEAAVKGMQSAGVRETKDVGEVEQRVKNRHGDQASASEIEDVALEVAAEKAGDPKQNRYIDFTATGSFAEAIDAAAEDRSATQREVVRTATKQWLKEEGYL